MEQNLEQLCIQVQQGKQDAREILEVCWPLLEQKAWAFWKDCKKQYKALGVTQQDLVQEGGLGLLNAIPHFDPEKGIPFEAYAKAAILHRMVDYVRAFDYTLEGKMLWDIVPLEEEFVGLQEEALRGIPSRETRPEPIVIRQDLQERFCRSYEALSARYQVYLDYRFGVTGEAHSRAETAAHFYLSDSRARKNEQQALDAFRKELEKNRYLDDGTRE